MVFYLAYLILGPLEFLLHPVKVRLCLVQLRLSFFSLNLILSSRGLDTKKCIQNFLEHRIQGKNFHTFPIILLLPGHVWKFMPWEKHFPWHEKIHAMGKVLSMA